VRQMVDKILNSYGTVLTLRHNGKDVAFKGFLQPGRSLSQRSSLRRISPLGEIFGDTYLYIGPAGQEAQVGDILMQGGNLYELRQLETVMYQNTPIYLWGLCVRKGGEDSWA